MTIILTRHTEQLKSLFGRISRAEYMLWAIFFGTGSTLASTILILIRG